MNRKITFINTDDLIASGMHRLCFSNLSIRLMLFVIHYMKIFYHSHVLTAGYLTMNVRVVDPVVIGASGYRNRSLRGQVRSDQVLRYEDPPHKPKQ